MIDIKILRQNPESVQDSITKRNLKIDLDAIIALDTTRLEQKQKLEELQALRNKVSKEIPTIADANLKQQKIAEMKQVGEDIKALEATLLATEDVYNNHLYSLPNFLSATTAIGPTEDDNKVESLFGEKTKFTFPPKTHYEIGEARGWIDTEKGAEISGSRFWYLKGDLVLLEFAILNYAVGELVKAGFTPIIPPYLVRENAMFGTGFFPADKNQIYNVNPEDDNLFLIGTSEVPVTSYHANEVMNVEQPVCYVGYSPCFRREAGTYGKDMKGILRGHQFEKIEMVCFCKPEDSENLHNTMVALEESIWQSFGIPYQKVNICSGDL